MENQESFRIYLTDISKHTLFSPEEERKMFENIDKPGIKDKIILNKKESEIIKLRFGFNDGIMWKLEEIGAKFGVSRERIRQIESRALKKLRTPKNRHRFEDFISDRTLKDNKRHPFNGYTASEVHRQEVHTEKAYQIEENKEKYKRYAALI